MLSDKILNGRYKGKAALHDHTVFYNGSENKIHVHDGLEYTTGVHRSGKIEEYQVQCKDEAFDLMKQYFYDLWD